MKKLYHSELGMPEKIKKQIPSGVYMLEYSRHAIQASKNDRYGKIPMVKVIDTNNKNINVIEVETVNNCITKILYRCKLNEKFDLCIAINPIRWIVKTVWLNCSTDKHKTLNKNLYDMV